MVGGKFEPKDRREQRWPQPPSVEDAGLFKHAITKMVLELTPEIRVNNRRDVVITAFVQNTEVEALFAGRRTADLYALREMLDKLRETGSRRKVPVQIDSPDGATVDSPCMPLVCEGAWRPRFWHDQDWHVHRKYQFIVARWVLRDSNRRDIVYGMSPVKEGMPDAL